MSASEASTGLLAAVRAARALLSRHENYLPSGYAADLTGRWRPVGSPDAVRFSLLGAVIRCGAKVKEFSEAARQLDPRIQAKLSQADPNLAHDEALDILDAIIARLEAGEPRRLRSGTVRRFGEAEAEKEAAAIEPATRPRRTR
jgi:hypothetical protein